MAELLTLPGSVDLHVHLREPSSNKSETIENGTRAARMGGYVLICDMPNNPGLPTWSLERLQEKRDIAHGSAETALGFYAGSQPESDNIGELGAMSRLAVGLKLYGAPGIEFAIPLLLQQYRIGNLSLKRLVEVTSTKPAEIIGVRLGRGTNVIWDLTPSRITKESCNQVKSFAGWTPYLGKIIGGRMLQRAPKINQIVTQREANVNSLNS